MSQILYSAGGTEKCESVGEGVEKIVLREEPGENRVLLRIAAGKAYPSQPRST
jgi:hypothetical protein